MTVTVIYPILVTNTRHHSFWGTHHLRTSVEDGMENYVKPIIETEGDLTFIVARVTGPVF